MNTPRKEHALTQNDTNTPTLLKGEVCVQYIRCNKHGCRCRDGQTHGPYYYRVWREAGRVRKEYVKAQDLAATREACDAYRVLLLRLRDLRMQRERLSHTILGEWRKAQRLLRHHPTDPSLSAAAPPPTAPRTAA